MKVYQVLDGIWQQLLRPCCVICGQSGSQGLALCGDCLRDLPWRCGGCAICADSLADPLDDAWTDSKPESRRLPAPGVRRVCGACLVRPPAFSRVVAPLSFATPVADWIRRFKFQGQLHYGRLLSHLFVFGGGTAGVDRIVPVPLHPRRLRQRGFNQSAELARLIGRELALTRDNGLLRRTRETIPQSTLSARHRRQSMGGVFSAAPAAKGLRVALVDDVLTTGSTADACARALLRAGARDVEVWVISRA